MIKGLLTPDRALPDQEGARVFIGSACGESQLLVKTLIDVAQILADIEVIHFLDLGLAIQKKSGIRAKDGRTDTIEIKTCSRKESGHKIHQRRKRRAGCKEPDDHRVARFQAQSIRLYDY